MAKGFKVPKDLSTRENRMEALLEAGVLILKNRKEHQKKNRKEFSAIVDEWVLAAEDVLMEQ